jgi:hypothetical protein
MRTTLRLPRAPAGCRCTAALPQLQSPIRLTLPAASCPSPPVPPGYYESWSANWVSEAAKLDLANLPSYINGGAAPPASRWHWEQTHWAAAPWSTPVDAR